MAGTGGSAERRRGPWPVFLLCRLSPFRRFGLLLLIAAAFLLSGCARTDPDAQVFRLDDHLAAAEVSAPSVRSFVDEAVPLRWDFEEQAVTWRPVSGRMGFKASGELIIKGEGTYPVITSPAGDSIDWARYDSILIRMLSTGGRVIRIKFEDQEYGQELGPPNQFQVYRFALNLNTPSYKGRLDILPTDSPSAPVAIDSIELQPRRMSFPEAAGLRFVGKDSDFRRAIYLHSPGTIRWSIHVPPKAVLRFAVGIAKDGAGVRFLVRRGRGGEILYETEAESATAWRDVEIDLGVYAGRRLDLVFETQGEKAVGFWANPVVATLEPKARPNVLVYMIDTLRAGHTSLHGYGRQTTPFLEGFGSEGVVFEDCHVQATWTKPSVVSLLTSLYPVAHRVQDFTDTIPPGATTLAEVLRGEGYVTATITGNPFSGRNSGLERGVDYLMEYPVLHRRRNRSEAATDSTALNAVAFPWLERHAGEPLFLYLHSTDPHSPYHPPAPFEALFADPAESRQFQRDNDKLRDIGRLYGGDAVFQPKEARAKGVDPEQWRRRATDRYDGEIAHNDHSIEKLIAKLSDLGILENTLVVVVSDHGEEFLEHGWTSHGHSLYQELTHSLLLMWNPALLPEPRRVSEPVQMVDVLPTILDLLGIESDGLFQGASLAGLIRGEEDGMPRTVLSSRLPEGGAAVEDAIPESRTGTYLRLDHGWKLIYRDRARLVGLPEIELYNRRADPLDADNVAAANPERASQMLQHLKEWTVGQRQVAELLGRGSPSSMDAATLERLRSLGYIGDR